jgi:hypothetical protein
MNCTQARDAMLIAEPAELAGVGDSELARHIVTCGPCAKISGAIGHDLQHLARSINRRSAARRSARRIALVAALPIAAAILVVFAVAPRTGAERRDVALKSLPPANVVSVDVAPGQRAAVLKTADPSVTLVWLREGGE